MDADTDSFERIKIDPINTRESDILSLMAKGLSNGQIALQLNLSQETVKWYNKHIFLKLGAASRTEAVAKAHEYGLLEDRAAAVPSEDTRPKHNLPAPLTSFVGREREIEEITRLLQSNRLLVLTGAGGSGKTRLALRIARKAVEIYRDGVWLVELAQLVDPAQVAPAVAHAFGLVSNAEETLETVVKRYLSRKQLLLVLDNFEHILPAAPLVGEILAAAPQVTVLVTSRERLHIYGENEYPVFPLSLPELGGRETPEQLLRYDALKLFIKRAQSIRPDFSLNAAQTTAAAQICIQLDGLPLALELAASQVKIYSLSQLAEQLKVSLTGLPVGPWDLPSRQRTLRATIEWSYALLSPEEKILFARLAVFKGGGTLDAVEQICGDANQAHVRECLTSLVDKNMIVPREGRDGELHFTLLETIREFAIECLDRLGEFNRLRHQHAGYYARLAERAEGEIQGAKQMDWFDRLQAERENVRSVLRWSSEEIQTDYDLRLVAALGYYWYYDGQSIEEAKHWTELALSKSKNTTVELSAGVKMTAGRIAINYGDLQGSRAHLKEANALYHQLGDDNKAAWALVYLSMTHLTSKPEAVEGLRICEEGLLYFRNENDRLGMSQALNILGELSRRIGNYEAARLYYEECQQMSRESGERLRIAMQYSNLASIAYRQMQPEKIGPFVKQAIQLFQELKNDYGVATSMVFMAGAAILTGKPERGARILGACQAHLNEMGARYQPSDRLEIEYLAQESLRMSGETLFREEWARGASMTFQETISYVLEGVE